MRSNRIVTLPDNSSHSVDELNSIITYTTPHVENSWTDRKMKEVHADQQKLPDCAIVNDHMYQHFPRISVEEEGWAWKLCIPTSMAARVLKANHNDPTVGYLTIRKTTNQVCSRYHWPGMFKDISR